MATIILEGPDSSGKTTLAYALIGWLGPEMGQYVKSPAGRTKFWDESWNEWNLYHLSKSSEKIYILDRTPEISELVYGPVVRGFTRLRDPLTSLLSLNHPRTLIIMTSTDKPYLGGQTDPSGNPIYEHRAQIKTSYDLLSILITYHGYQVGSWDYQESKPNRVTSRINTIFDLPKSNMMSKDFEYYRDKGKVIVNE